MILKEAYRYQNYLNTMIRRASMYLDRANNVTIVTEEHMRSKAQPGAVDETMDNLATREMNTRPDDVIQFGLRMLEEKESVSKAIDEAKAAHCPEVDRGIAINRLRQEFLATLKGMAKIKKRERMTSNSAYCFNAEGNQVPYRYDVKETTDVDFDRNAVKEAINRLQATCDDTSNNADYCLTSVEVDFKPAFNINESFEDQVENFVAGLARA